MAPVFHPPIDEHDHFSTPLNDGERRVRDLLKEKLDESWHVFVQPHLLNQQPDFLLVSQAGGISVVEVKDWRAKGHRCMQHKVLEVMNSEGDWVRTSQDPVMQVMKYKRGISERFLIPPGVDSELQTKLFTQLNAVVILPQWRSAEASLIFKKSTSLSENDQRFVHVLGEEVFSSSERFNVMLFGGSRKPHELDQRVFSRFISRLEEPEAVAEQRQKLRLSRSARAIVDNPQSTKIRRLRGPAGSGKTVALAARAAVLASQGKSVLILTFNITLAHYIATLVGRHCRELGADRRMVDCIHIHGFCADVRSGYGGVILSDDLFSSESDEPWDEYIEEVNQLYARRVRGLPKYDAVIVDEGQDFKLPWWNFIRTKLVNGPESELLLAADISQDIYKRKSWTDAPMPDAGFVGRWNELEGSYRLPVDFIPIAQDFARAFVGDDVNLPTIPNDHDGIAARPTYRRWINAVNASHELVAEMVTKEINELLKSSNGLHEADIVIITNTHSLGVEIMEKVSAEGIQSEHIFTETNDRERRRKKERFWPGAPFLKGSTLHSFKGWEGRSIIYVSDRHGESSLAREPSAAMMVYVALTRLKGDPSNRPAFISVINRHHKFEAHKEVFERQVTSKEVPQLAGQQELDL
jgi:hypothetical protein